MISIVFTMMGSPLIIRFQRMVPHMCWMVQHMGWVFNPFLISCYRVVICWVICKLFAIHSKCFLHHIMQLKVLGALVIPCPCIGLGFRLNLYGIALHHVWKLVLRSILQDNIGFLKNVEDSLTVCLETPLKDIQSFQALIDFLADVKHLRNVCF